ncbi:BLUF domain-containing protein [Salegentibacter sp. F63223]|nr:BLUF domain-containing protein [Salegentibacter maritimus]
MNLLPGNFYLYFEGKEKQVDSLYSKIARDKRHKNVIEIDSGFSEKRTFSNWPMTFKS